MVDELTLLVANLVSFRKLFNGEFYLSINPAHAYFFCDSTWLEQQDPSSQAFDFEGNPIFDNGSGVAINAIPEYRNELTGNNVPWWSGYHANVYGYTFAPTLNEGGNYCQLSFKQWLLHANQEIQR